MNELRSLVQAVEEMMTGLARSLPHGAAELRVEPSDATDSRGAMFILIPSNPSAARVHIDVDELSGVVGVSLGRGAVFEVPREGHRYSDLGCVDEIRALCIAAIRGKLRETVWFKGGEVVGAEAKAKIGTAEVGDSWRQLFTNPFRRRVKRSFEYEPYA